ncbi:hypothetical protein JCM10908_001697 [Rhodotorula pacifica]|uniref:Mhf1p n=1 Tax=Rhodotorula pacifica TaxID=1495444 RepID=UPI00316B6D4A
MQNRLWGWSRQSLKAAVWYTVTKIAQEEELSLPFAASEHFVAALAEVVFQQALSLGKDLESFAKHAGRLTINADDVKLAARRNEPMYESLTTAAIQHGLTLADLRADSASTSRAGSAKPKAVKAPRLAAAKADAAPKPAPKPKKADGKMTAARSRTTSTSKGKGKAKVVESASEDEGDTDPQLVPSQDDEPDGGGGGGFVKASALKKGKRRAVESSEEEEEGELVGSEDDIASDSSDERRKKGRKRTKSAGTSKRRKSGAD